MLMKNLLVFLYFVLFSIANVDQQTYGVACVVFNSVSNVPIEGALCTDQASKISGVTNKDGYFLFPIAFPVGIRTMIVYSPHFTNGSKSYYLNSNMNVKVSISPNGPVFSVACVVKDESSNPIIGALCVDGDQSGITNKDGYFFFPKPFPVEERVMRASKDDFESGCTPYFNDHGQNVFIILRKISTLQKPCTDQNGKPLSYKYCDSSLSPELRASDLVKYLTIKEKSASLGASIPSIPRLGVPQVNMGEALHGVLQGCTQNRCPTSFPAASALAASFDPQLFQDVGRAIGLELRALSNYNTKGLSNGPLLAFTPNVNLVRDPRWGRAQEAPGEDPILTSVYAHQFIAGVQGEGLTGFLKEKSMNTLLAGSVAKHYVAYSLEGNWNTPGLNGSTWRTAPWKSVPNYPSERFNYDSEPYQDDYNDYYLEPWKAVAKVGTGVMCSYNAIFGIPSCLNSKNLNLLRNNLGFNGFVVSDFMALAVAMDCQNWVNGTCQNFPGHGYIAQNNPLKTLSISMSAGTDTNLGQLYANYLEQAINQKSVNIDLVNQALVRVFTPAFRLGLFDSVNDYSCLSLGVVDSVQHRNLALQAARESIVMLKNNGVLPLSKSSRVAFIGPHANATEAMLSNYHGDNNLVNSHSPLQVAISRQLSVLYSKGCNVCDQKNFPNYPNAICPKKPIDKSGFPDAYQTAMKSDIVVLFLGLDQTFEAESFDRNSSFSWGPRTLGVPDIQIDLFNLILNAGKPVVVVLMNGGALSIETFQSKSGAIIESWYGGELGGDAIVDVLFGNYSPSGRMPVTTYFENFANQRDFRDLSLKPSGSNPGLTHLYYSDPVLYQFGYGLSYSNFKILSDDITSTIVIFSGITQSININVKVLSLGPHPKSDYVLLLFVGNKLATFHRFHDIEPNEIRQVDIKIDSEFFKRKEFTKSSQFENFEISIGPKNSPETIKRNVKVIYK